MVHWLHKFKIVALHKGLPVGGKHGFFSDDRMPFFTRFQDGTLAGCGYLVRWLDLETRQKVTVLQGRYLPGYAECPLKTRRSFS
jgi:hypothetical protein